MATAALKRWGLTAAAVLAAATLVVLALHGRRPDPGLERFQAAGLMLAILPDQVTAVEVARDGRRWRFERAMGAWLVAPGSPAAAADFAERVERGLRFLHVTAPQRTLTLEEVGGTSATEFGLDPPRYVVSAETPSGGRFTVAFGALNPQGLARYVRIAGSAEVALLPRFAGEAWEAATAAP